MKLLYPTSIPLRLDQHLRDHHPSLHPSLSLVAYDPCAPTIPDAHLDADVLVVWSNTPTNLADAAARLPRLRWVQCLAAGPDNVLAAGFDPTRTVITSGTGLHSGPVAEHALALLLCAARRLHEMRDCQARRQWAGHLRGDPVRPDCMFSTLRGARVLVWGFGSIAQTLAPHLAALGATVRGVARHVASADGSDDDEGSGEKKQHARAGFDVFSENDLPRLLRETDALVMILPASSTTRHALNADRIACLGEHAWVVNVGRGSSVDEAALVDALERGRIAGAALDVFDEEPLPPSSPLWTAPNVIISPHAAGNRPRGAEKLIADNLELFVAGRPLINTMQREE